MANKRFIVRHGLDNSGDNSVVNTIINVAEPVNNSDAATKYYVDTHTTGGTVTSVTATSPVESTGGTTPVISLGTGANGQLVIGTGTGFTKSTLTAGTGVSIANASGSITISATGSGGDVVGPASATDNAVTRFDSTTGKLIQNSTVTLDDNGNFGNVNSVVLDNTPATLPTGAGTMYWEDGEGTPEVILKGGNTTLKVGTQEYARVYNDSGSTITLGQVVYISGAQGNRVAVKLAQADVEANSFGTLGLVAETIANGAEGWVIVSGALYKLNTNGLTAGAVVYLSPTTAGAYTTTKPQAPDQLVVLGFVERVSSTVGSIYVKVDNGYELDELHDVRITSPVSGNTLIYDATTSPTGVWKNASITAGTGISVTNGAGSITIGNTGVTSVSGTSPVVSSGGATPAISLASGYGDTQNPYGSKTANYFLASPNGSAGVPTWRSIVAADIPTLNQNTTGNAATASALQTARNINGVSFNGTADITVTAAASTLTGTTLASGVTASSLTSVGTLTGLTVSGTTSLATSSGSVGIGTASPASRLTISGTGTGAWFTVNRTDSGTNIIDFTQSGSRLGYVGYNGNDLYLNQASAANTIFFTNNTERMRIINSGDVGIGTSSPSTKLHVANGGSNAQATFVGTTGSPYITVVANSGTTILGNESNGGWVGTTGSQAFVFKTNDTERMRLDSSGNLGIGVTPSQKLDVNGAMVSRSGNTAAHTSAAVFDYDGNVGANRCIAYGPSGTVGSFTWLAASGNGSATERMRIDSSGNVGIGGTASSGTRLYVVGSNTTSNTSIPIYANQVYGNTGVSSAAIRLNLNDGAGGCYLYGYSGGAGFMHNAEYLAGTGWTARSTFASIMETTSSGFSFYLNSSLTAGNTFTPSEQMRLTSTGLGIGTSSPAAKLDVNGQVRAAYASGFQVDNAGTMLGKLYYSGGLILDRAASTSLFIAQNGSNQVTLDSSGNLGLGTSSPAANLSVSGSSNTGIRIKGGSSALSYIDFDEADSGTPNGSIAYVHSTNHMTFGTGGSNAERMRIDSSGNLLIGNTNGTEKLTVTGKIKASDVLLGNNGTKGYGAITTTTSTSTPTGGSSGDFTLIY